jgi:hypothetical protein
MIASMKLGLNTVPSDRHWHSVLLVLLAALSQVACQHVPPTIAHTHIGHAITGFDGTPGDKGLLVVAEEQSAAALELMKQAMAAGNSETRLKQLVGESVSLTTDPNFGVKEAVSQVDNHILFAAKSEDASDNLQRSIGPFSEGADAILTRCDLIALLGNDVAQSRDGAELKALTEQIYELTYSNTKGANGNGVRGSKPSQYGTTQLRAEIDAILARERPPYTPVDQWYLFHLVKLPDCNNCWGWQKWANSSNRGY